MGCFDYECECKGKTCEHIGGQLHDSNVVIEVPLSDGTVVYLKGHYEEYGYVVVGDYHFYLEQFREYFEGWLEHENPERLGKIFLATRIWTLNETIRSYDYDDDGNEHVSTIFKNRYCYAGDRTRVSADVNPAILSKYIRLDANIDLDKLRNERIQRLKTTIEFMQKELGRLNRP